MGITGDILFSNSGLTKRGIQGTVGDSDQWFVGGGATEANAGFMEIATGDDNGTEPIHVRQYSGSPLVGTSVRTLTLLDGSGNSSFPGTLSVASSLAVGTANLFVNTVTGNVGIGTTNPRERLDIIGNSRTIGRNIASESLTLVGTYSLFHHRSDSSFDGLIGRTGNFELDSEIWFSDSPKAFFMQIPSFSGDLLYTFNPRVFSGDWYEARLRSIIDGSKPVPPSNTTYNDVRIFSSRDTADTMVIKGNVGIGTTNPNPRYTIHMNTTRFNQGILFTNEQNHSRHTTEAIAKNIYDQKTVLITRAADTNLLDNTVIPDPLPLSHEIALGFSDTYRNAFGGFAPLFHQIRFNVSSGGAATGFGTLENIMTLQGDGKVGIGKTNPGAALDVVGDTNISGDLAVGGTLREDAGRAYMDGLSPNIWSVGGESQDRITSSAISLTAGTFIQKVNGRSVWVIGSSGNAIDISSIITPTSSTVTQAIALGLPRPVNIPGGSIANQVIPGKPSTNHSLGFATNGKAFFYDNFGPSGGGITTSAEVDMTKESVLVARRDGTTVSFWYNGINFENVPNYTEIFDPSITPTRTRLGDRGQIGTATTVGLGYAAYAAWSRALTDVEIRFMTYDRMTAL
jgi:hypothetical protein